MSADEADQLTTDTTNRFVPSAISSRTARADALLAILRALRRRVAPAGSVRERLARAIYVPVVNRLFPAARSEESRDTIIREIVQIDGEPYRPPARRPIERILVLKLDHIGDFILGMPALQAIRDGFPQAHITLVCGSWNEPLARALGWIDRIVTFNFFPRLNRDWSGPRQELYDSVRMLPLHRYDLAIDLRHDPDTRPCTYRVDAAARAGYAAPEEPGLPQLDLILPPLEAAMIDGKRSMSLHAEFRLELLAAAVVTAFGARKPHPTTALVKPLGQDGKRRFAVLAIGAGDPIRCWPLESYGALGRDLVALHDLDIVVLGGSAEQDDIAELAAALPTGCAEAVINRPLPELPTLLASASLCICNGSAISHLSAALGVPTVCVLGGTTRMSVWHPAGPHVIAIGGMTPCQPCGLHYASECPWDVACLRVITPAQVLAACERLLALGSPRPE